MNMQKDRNQEIRQSSRQDRAPTCVEGRGKKKEAKMGDTELDNYRVRTQNRATVILTQIDPDRKITMSRKNL